MRWEGRKHGGRDIGILTGKKKKKKERGEKKNFSQKFGEKYQCKIKKKPNWT